MGQRNPAVDAYIAKSADFAKPILNHVRALVHAACPEVEETLKWQFPCFEHQGILCNLAAFKQHCAFGFWKGALILGRKQGAGENQEKAMGHFGRITSLADLPSDKVLLGYLREAVRLNETGAKVPGRSRPKKSEPVVVPPLVLAALKKNKKAFAAFQKFPPSHQLEYIEWITGAKQEETRQRRLATALVRMAEGKSRNWKYKKR